jgi:two-component sensor histidine kinase
MTESVSPLPIADEQLLLSELNHRINNEFAAAIGAVSLAAARSGNREVKVALNGVTELLHQYADVHRLLQVPNRGTAIDAAAYLHQLCLAISRSKLDHRKINLTLSAQPLLLPADRCWRLGMIVYELVTNAAQHAFAGDGGDIKVELRRLGALVVCSVRDNGSAVPRHRRGHGIKLIDAVAKSLDGRFDQRFAAKGSASIVVLPGNDGCHIERDQAGRRAFHKTPHQRWPNARARC